MSLFTVCLSTMSLVGKRLCIERVGSIDELKASFECRMSALEAKLDLVVNTCSTILSTCEKLIETHSHMSCCSQDIMSKMEAIEDFMKKVIPVYTENHTEQTTPVVLLPLNKPVSNSEMKAFTLNSEAECPEGSWLGDENNPEGRVRVQIPPTMLLHINEHSLTPEKMALTLLDCLFPREVLAVSNLSGKGKHSKQQLDPLLIYGIRCHLMYKFNITECDWIRIKQNIDSKCRSVWRRKEKGLSLGSSKPNTTVPAVPLVASDDSSDGSPVFNIHQGPMKNGTKEPLVQVHDGQTIKVFTDDVLEELLPISSSVELFSVEDNDCFGLASQKLIVSDTPEKLQDEDSLYSSKGNEFLVKLEKKLE